MQGAAIGEKKYLDSNIKYNDCYKYAIVRNILHQEKNKDIEILANYEPKMYSLIEWWKQLYGESEGKEGKGIFPVGVTFTTELHSLGQYIQEGKRNLFETVMNVENTKTDMKIKLDEDNLDGLNFLANKTMSYVNKKAMEGTIEAHVSGGVPNIVISLKDLSEESIGELIYFFELACSVSGKLLGVDPFNQPGVEAYKKNMFRLLGKPTVGADDPIRPIPTTKTVAKTPNKKVKNVGADSISAQKEKPKKKTIKEEKTKTEKKPNVGVGAPDDPKPKTTTKTGTSTPKKRGRPPKHMK